MENLSNLELLLWSLVGAFVVGSCLAIRVRHNRLSAPVPLSPKPEPAAKRELVSPTGLTKAEVAYIRGQAEGAVNAINAMHRHLGIQVPLVVSLPSLRQEPIEPNCADLGEYLDTQATARLDALAYFIKENGETTVDLWKALSDPSDEMDPDKEHYVMPQSPLDEKALEMNSGR